MATGAVVAAVVALPVTAGGVSTAEFPANVAGGLLTGGVATTAAPERVTGIVGTATDDLATDDLADPFGEAPDALPVVGAPPSGDPSALAANGIPEVALRAYQSAAGALSLADPSCRLDWALLAGIGRVESNHGRYGGAVVGPDGVSRPPIIGVRLDGSVPNTMVIRDSDGGRLDGDSQFDRAVGPMQFLPGSWSVFGTDGDGDGVRDPQNIHDAALAAAAYLCSGSDDLSSADGASAAVRRYNNSADYVRLVLGLADTYRRGTAPPDLPVTPAPGPVPVLSTPPLAPAAPPTAIGVNPGTPGTSPGGVDPSQPVPVIGPGSGTSGPGTSTSSPASSPTSSGTKGPTRPSWPTVSRPTSGSGTSTGTGTSSPTSSATSSPTSSPPSSGGSSGGSSTSPAPTPTSPGDTSTPVPTDTSTGGGPTTGPTSGPGSDPTPQPTTSTPEPVTTTVTCPTPGSDPSGATPADPTCATSLADASGGP